MTTHPIRGESEVIKLINIFLDGLVSVGNDAGQTGPNILAKMIEFGGEIPKSSGYAQSNQAMIEALQMYRDKHHDYALIERIVWRLLSKPVTALFVVTLLVEHYYHSGNLKPNGNDESGPLEAYSDEDRVAYWVKHMAELGIQEPMRLKYPEALRVYRYGLREAGPRLIRRELKIS